MGEKPRAAQAVTQVRRLLGRHWWLWLGCFAGGAAIHLGTALLRLGSFLPTPQAVDFSSYYAGAWSIRLGLSPYTWPASLLSFLAGTQGLATTPPTHNSSPLWSWLLQPLTVLPFPSAATLWLLLLLVVAAGSHILLVRAAGCYDWKVTALTLPVTLTFGPLFLNLTLGQNAVFLLFAVLLLARALTDGSRGLKVLAVAAWVVAVSAKVFPALWIVVFPLLKRWRALVTAGAVCLAAFGIIALSQPEISADYWLGFLPSQTQGFASGAGIDDQSLSGFLSRVGASHSYAFPGLSLEEGHRVTWSFPWNLSAQAIGLVSAALLLALAAWLASSWLRSGSEEPEGILFSLVLFVLLLFPHMERYNHIVALPAMAWLWRRGIPYRNLSLVAYALFGLSRLNHLWALLPAPVAAVASGFGLFAVLVLLCGLSHAMARSPIGAKAGSARAAVTGTQA